MNLTYRWGKVLRVLSRHPWAEEVEVLLDGEVARAIGYPSLVGSLAEGEEVLLNTTAVELRLGSGGVHFVLLRRGREALRQAGPGHLMKDRYTPWQRAYLHLEEEGSPYHELLKDPSLTLEGAPVALLFLHSQLEPLLRAFWHLCPGEKAVYLYTGGGARPAGFSRTVRRLAEEGLTVITVGEAFGGHLEAVAGPSALLAAVHGLRARLVAVGMGPGIAGTGTPLGHTAVEVSAWALWARSLGGRPLIIPRLSSGDPRGRHYGLSHHTLSVLERLFPWPLPVAFPAEGPFPEEALKAARERWKRSEASRRHLLLEVAVGRLWEAVIPGLKGWSHMGRGPLEDPLFLGAPLAGAAILAAWQKGV